MSTEQARAMRELTETTEHLEVARREVARLEKVQTARMIRAVALGSTRGEVGEVTGLSRQRIQQITAGVDRGNTDRASVKALAALGRPRTQDGTARRAALNGGK